MRRRVGGCDHFLGRTALQVNVGRTRTAAAAAAFFRPSFLLILMSPLFASLPCHAFLSQTDCTRNWRRSFASLPK